MRTGHTPQCKVRYLRKIRTSKKPQTRSIIMGTLNVSARPGQPWRRQNEKSSMLRSELVWFGLLPDQLTLPVSRGGGWPLIIAMNSWKSISPSPSESMSYEGLEEKYEHLHGFTCQEMSELAQLLQEPEPSKDIHHGIEPS